MANTALRCTNPACSARGEVQTSKTCVVCHQPTSWSVLRVPPPSASQVIGPIYTAPMPTQGAKPPKGSKKKDHQAGVQTRTCVTEGCARYHLAQSDPFCGACGAPTIPALTT